MLSLQTHEPVIRDGKQVDMKVTPYLRVCTGDGPPIFIQKGRLYGEGGGEIKDPPEWFKDELNKIDKKALEKVGYEVKRPGRPKNGTD